MEGGRKKPGPDDIDVRASKMEELGRVSAELIHDMSGALGILSSRIVLTRDDVRLGRASVEDLDRIHRDCESIRSMVTDILIDLRGGMRSPEVAFPLVESLEETIDRWLIGSPGLTTRLSASVSRDARVAGPRSFFDRAVQNLLTNGARHARSELQVSLIPDDDAEGEHVLLSVDDDGAGVEPPRERDLFEPFVRGSGGTTGLGLSVVRWAARRLGGDVHVSTSSALGGASFRVRLPVIGGRTGNPSRVRWRRAGGGRQPPDRIALAGLRVAIVEDEPMLRDLYERLLQRSGAQGVAISPTAARDEGILVSQIAAADPDVILLDLDLGPLQGIEVWRCLRERSPSLASRVLFLTGAAALEPSLPEEDAPPTLSKLLDWSEVAEHIRAAAG